jgi:hypothetical protein
VSAQALRKALEEAERSHRLDVRAIDAAVERVRGRNGPGHQRIRQALAELARIGTTVTRSALESRFLALLDAHGLPRRSANAWTEGMEVDACWRRERIVVELDGWGPHKTRRRSSATARAPMTFRPRAGPCCASRTPTSCTARRGPPR